MIIKKTKKGYEAHKLASEQINEVEMDRGEKLQLEKKKNPLLTYIKSSQKELRYEQRQLRKLLDMEERIEGLEKKIDSILEALNKKKN